MPRERSNQGGADSSPTTDRSDSSIDRRAYLKIAGILAGSVGGISLESDIARAASDGYGEGGYGEGGYGGVSGFSVATQSSTNVGSSSATLNGELSDLGGADSADCYFEWRQTGASSWNVTSSQTLSATGSYSDSLSGLEDGIEYEYRAAGDASDGDSDTGGTVTFTTTDDQPTVTTESPSNVGTTSVTLNGSLDDLGGASSADCYFEWRAVGADTWNTTSKQTLSSTGSFSADVADLVSGTDYEYYAVTLASDGDQDSGSTVSFTTENNSSPPTIDRYSVTEAGSPNPHAEITADWGVGDDDGDLSSVLVQVYDSSGSLVDSATTSVSGTGASGSDKFKIKHVSGQTFDVTLTVTDSEGNSSQETQSVTE